MSTVTIDNIIVPLKDNLNDLENWIVSESLMSRDFMKLVQDETLEFIPSVKIPGWDFVENRNFLVAHHAICILTFDYYAKRYNTNSLEIVFSKCYLAKLNEFPNRYFWIINSDFNSEEAKPCVTENAAIAFKEIPKFVHVDKKFC